MWVAPDQQPPEIPRGFHVLERCRTAEQTCAWIGRDRRMSRDYERLGLVETGEVPLYALSFHGPRHTPPLGEMSARKLLGIF